MAYRNSRLDSVTLWTSHTAPPARDADADASGADDKPSFAGATASASAARTPAARTGGACAPITHVSTIRGP